MTTIYDDCSKEELLQIVSEMQSDLKYRKNENNSLYKETSRLREVIKIKDAERVELVKENKKLKSCLTIADNDYKKCYAENVRLAEENKELQGIIDDLQSDLVRATNDYKQAVNEVKLLNSQLDRQNTSVNDLADIVETSHKTIDALKEENKELKFRIKMLTKVHLNSIYGLCNVLDNTKETKDNDSNN